VLLEAAAAAVALMMIIIMPSWRPLPMATPMTCVLIIYYEDASSHKTLLKLSA